MKHALHFASKLNSRDFQICNCFWVPSYDLFTSARKAVFPAPTTTGVHRLRNTWSSLWEVICHKKVQQSFLNQSLDSSNQKFLDPPLNCSPILWPSHSFVYLSMHENKGNTRGTYCKLNSIFSVVEFTTSMHSITANNQCALSDVYK